MENTSYRFISKDLLPKGYKLIYLTEYGSKLYGTNSESSDTDYKGLYIPSIEDVVLGKAKDQLSFKSNSKKDTRNTNEDIDIELYSIQKYFSLLKKGETGAIDILYSMFREDTILYSSYEIKSIKQNHSKLVSKNSKAFIGYCMQQASKYGIKGSRYGDLIELDKFLNGYNADYGLKMKTPISQIYKSIPETVYIKKIEKNNLHYISVLGKLHQDNITIDTFHDRIKHELSKYGERTAKANTDDGVDWKALSHAYRVIYQLNELAETGGLVFPLKDAEKIKQVKYCKDKVELPKILENIHKLLKETEIKVKNSDLPDEVSTELLDKITLVFYDLI